jgi:putative hydrolase of HD superfamily
MTRTVQLLFEALMLRFIPRSGYAFLGAGRESVAEHSFLTALIGWVLARLTPQADAARLVGMCLLHDLPEARTGDLNSVQKRYVSASAAMALDDALAGTPLAGDASLVHEFEEAASLEAQLARDADQLAFLLDLKRLADLGLRPAPAWARHVSQRLRTEAGRLLATHIQRSASDEWWLDSLVDTPGETL